MFWTLLAGFGANQNTRTTLKKGQIDSKILWRDGQGILL